MEQSLTLWISENGKRGHFYKTGCTLLATLKKKMNCKCNLKIELIRKFKTEKNTKKLNYMFLHLLSITIQDGTEGHIRHIGKKNTTEKEYTYFPN